MQGHLVEMLLEMRSIITSLNPSSPLSKRQCNHSSQLSSCLRAPCRSSLCTTTNLHVTVSHIPLTSFSFSLLALSLARRRSNHILYLTQSLAISTLQSHFFLPLPWSSHPATAPKSRSSFPFHSSAALQIHLSTNSSTSVILLFSEDPLQSLPYWIIVPSSITSPVVAEAYRSSYGSSCSPKVHRCITFCW